MLNSMTGQGIAEAANGQLTVTVEIRAVNNRYFKVNFRLPDTLYSMEPEIEKQLHSRIHRGSITIFVHVQSLSSPSRVCIDTPLIEYYQEQFRLAFGDQELSLKPETLVSLPGVVAQPKDEWKLDDSLRDLVLGATESATGQVVQMRLREGAKLSEDLLSNLHVISNNLSEITTHAPLVAQHYEKKIVDRVNQRLEQHEITMDAKDVIREVAIFADKCDISEELVRLQSHLQQMSVLMSSGDNSGRTLDFLTQELLREINTIGSKANDALIATLVVDTKTAIDRIKEQIQNIE